MNALTIRCELSLFVIVGVVVIPWTQQESITPSFCTMATKRKIMGLWNLLKDKIYEAELKARIKKELQAKTLETVQKYKGHPNIGLSLLKGAMDNLYKFPIVDTHAANEVYQSEIFKKLLEEEINKAIEELVTYYNVENKTTYSRGTTSTPIDNENTLPKKIDKFILPKKLEHFIILEESEKAIKKGLINSKEEEADYLVQLMDQEEELIKDEKLCPLCHALNTVKNKHCYVCNRDF